MARLPAIPFLTFAILINSFLLISPAPNHTQGTCVLDFNASQYEYMPFGECGSVKEDITNWGSTSDGFPTTVCCRNSLTLLSDALASQVRNSTGQIFLSQQQWQSCNKSFHPQQGMSLSSCGFDNIYYGSSKCSNLYLLDAQNLQQFTDALQKCSHFDHSFEESCLDCTSAILSLRDGLYDKMVGKDNYNDTERAICGVAALVSVAFEQQDDPFLADKFLRCFPPPAVYNKKSSMKKLVLGVLVVAILALLIIVFLVKCVSKKKPVKKHAQLKQIATWSGLYWFTKTEIENAMNFENEKINLGRGSAGEVYRGVLPSGQVVAIKHLIKSNTSSSDSFTRELAGLSRLRHPNLVCLFGCCMEDGERYLVYEFCANGNLAQHLLRRDSHLTWEARVRILRECSFALKYLHHHIEGCVVHRDIKLTNILLTEKYEAKLSDFGLSRMMGMEESKVFTDVRGTIGYMDPEYMSNAKLTCASDVYSFGIVALQILSGQKVIELDLDARDQLTRKARDVSMGKRPLSDFVDSRLKGQVDKTDFGTILQIAVLCVAKSSTGRPSIEVVFDELDKVYRDIEARKKTTPTPSTTTSTSSSN
ncbi:unnamed protein product [Lathyrus oleraceus]